MNQFILPGFSGHSGSIRLFCIASSIFGYDIVSARIEQKCFERVDILNVSFLGQPLQIGAQTVTWLRQQLNNSNITQLQIGVAWMKRSGLSRLRTDLIGFRERGGTISAIIGIDEGGATRQGLRLALDLFDEVYIFHDPSSRTFHPKVYLAFGADEATLLVGSSNVTAGGLFSNYEASLACRLDPAVEEDQSLLLQVNEWFATLRSDIAVCKRLDENLLQTLSDDGRYNVADEDQRRQQHRNGGDRDSVTTDIAGQSLFGKASIPRTGLAPRVTANGILRVPRASSRQTASPSRTGARGRVPAHVAPVQIGQLTAVAPVHVTRQRWYKQLSASDAQQPRTLNSNPTGNLKLTRARFPIDQVTYFRQEMFSNAVWVGRQTPRGIKEEAIVPFEVVVEGQSRGQVNLRIDHADYRVAGQSNVPTWLHWGTLQQLLSATNYRGAWVLIERDHDGRFRLEITRINPT